MLFDSLNGGSQAGSTQTVNTVAVSNGVFTVSLDFGASAFNGANRFLQISARPSTGGAFTLLSPRQQITSTPYAVRSLNATAADTVAVNGTSAFSVTGVGSFMNSNTFAGVGAGAATTPNGNGVGSDNSFFGNRAGERNTTGFYNSFFGESAGFNNTTASNNSFFGKGAGQANDTGNENSFFGFNAGNANTTGATNSFFGSRAGTFSTTGFQNSFFGFQTGLKNTEGSDNAFFGSFAGQVNTTGSSNSVFGGQAGFANITGSRNSFFGFQAGSSNASGDRNTLIGFRADVLTGPLLLVENATAIGARARVDQSNALVLGSINGVNGATADTNVGIGTTAPTARLSVVASGPGARVLHLGIERAWV
ncbi:MAG TPA: hypothetical protein VIU65_02320, partial [Pyrinomonadaceae bacterium]